MNLPSTFEALITEANQLNLYKKLLLQLNKDFLLANIFFDLEEEISPSNLKLLLHETVYKLIQENFSE